MKKSSLLVGGLIKIFQSKIRTGLIFSALFFVLILSFMGHSIQVRAQEQPLPPLTLEGLSPIPEQPKTPGRLEGTGTFFEIKDSEYLNISLKSSAEINILMESMPRMISLDLRSSSSNNLTTLTMGGLEPNKTYYKYDNSYKDETIFATDSDGRYTFSQDLIQPHHVWLQEHKSTVFLPDQCSTYGVWDAQTSTCTLNQDLNQSIEMTADNMVLDCVNHNITGSQQTGYGVYINSRSNITVKNCRLSNFYWGIYLRSSAANRLVNNFASNNLGGLQLYDSSNNNLDNNTSQNNSFWGIYFSTGSNNILKK